MKLQKGFTLVELAIVVLIIGLLIGGVLRGQELIRSAEITSTVNDIRSYEVAITTFRDQYGTLPGDLRNADNRLAGCSSDLPCSAGSPNGNGILSNSGSGTGNSLGSNQSRTATNETFLFWNHLATAELVTGINTEDSSSPTFGENMPAADIGGGFLIGYWRGTGSVSSLSPAGGSWTSLPSGHYLSLVNEVNSISTSNVSLTPNDAARIDRKIDDGNPGAGNVRAIGSDTCVVNVGEEDAATYIYNEAEQSIQCGLIIGIQK